MNKSSTRLDMSSSIFSILLTGVILFKWIADISFTDPQYIILTLYTLGLIAAYYTNIIIEAEMALLNAMLFDKNIYKNKLETISKCFYRIRSFLFISFMILAIVFHIAYMITTKGYHIHFLIIILETFLICFIIMKYTNCAIKYNKYMKEWFKNE